MMIIWILLRNNYPCLATTKSSLKDLVPVEQHVISESVNGISSPGSMLQSRWCSWSESPPRDCHRVLWLVDWWETRVLWLVGGLETCSSETQATRQLLATCLWSLSSLSCHWFITCLQVSTNKSSRPGECDLSKPCRPCSPCSPCRRRPCRPCIVYVYNVVHAVDVDYGVNVVHVVHISNIFGWRTCTF